jgi:hypothetical protein
MSIARFCHGLCVPFTIRNTVISIFKSTQIRVPNPKTYFEDFALNFSPFGIALLLNLYYSRFSREKEPKACARVCVCVCVCVCACVCK